jgi:peroxiredoxin
LTENKASIHSVSIDTVNQLLREYEESAMSIQQAAAEYKAKAQGMLGEKFSIITYDMERIRTAGTINNALKVGQSVPEFTLPDAFGEEISLKTLLVKGPVVISFYRGEWCPFCNIELHGLQEALPKMQELGATLIAISPEKPDWGIVATQKNKLTFPVLSDFGNTVARQFGIVFQIGQELKEFSKNVFKNDIALRNGEDSYELPVPATYVIDATGLIRYAHVDVDYMMGRAEPEVVVAALQAIAHPVAR